MRQDPHQFARIEHYLLQQVSFICQCQNVSLSTYSMCGGALVVTGVNRGLTPKKLVAIPWYIDSIRPIFHLRLKRGWCWLWWQWLESFTFLKICSVCWKKHECYVIWGVSTHHWWCSKSWWKATQRRTFSCGMGFWLLSSKHTSTKDVPTQMNMIITCKANTQCEIHCPNCLAFQLLLIIWASGPTYWQYYCTDWWWLQAFYQWRVTDDWLMACLTID